MVMGTKLRPLTWKVCVQIIELYDPSYILFDVKNTNCNTFPIKRFSSYISFIRTETLNWDLTLFPDEWFQN